MIEILKEVADLDILVLCAAVTHVHTPTEQISTQEVQITFDTNVIAPFDLVKAYLALPTPASGSKTVLNISSASAHLGITAQAGYGASNAAFNQILQAFAAQHTPAKDGVRLFSLHPGAFYTPLAAAQYPACAFVWEDISLPAHFCTWMALAGAETDFLHGRFVWAHWDADELLGLRERAEKEPGFLKIGLVL